MDTFEQTYCLIITVFEKDGNERLFPLVVDSRDEADALYSSLLNNEIKEISHLTGDLGGATAYPFLYIVKTYISNDKILMDENDQDLGEIQSEMIPVDYISEVVDYKSHPELSLSNHIESIINLAVPEREIF
jgi:hypothetical protein